MGYMSDRGLPFCPEIRIALAYLFPNAGALSENLKYTQTANVTQPEVVCFFLKKRFDCVWVCVTFFLLRRQLEKFHSDW